MVPALKNLAIKIEEKHEAKEIPKFKKYIGKQKELLNPVG